MGTYVRAPVEFVRGEGTRLWDAEGNEYLDFLAGISVVQIGHCHPALVEAIREQAGRLMHVSNLYYTEPSMRLAKRLAQVSGGMRPKLEACVRALTAGVGAAHIVDGRRPHSLLLELFTDEGIGTKLWP